MWGVKGKGGWGLKQTRGTITQTKQAVELGMVLPEGKWEWGVLSHATGGGRGCVAPVLGVTKGCGGGVGNCPVEGWEGSGVKGVGAKGGKKPMAWGWGVLGTRG